MYQPGLFLMMITLIMLSCSSPEEIKMEAKRQLEERYGEKFDILSYTEIVLEKPRYEMTACPEKDTSYVFKLYMNKNDGVVMDNYVYMHWVYEATDSLRSFLKERNKKIAVLVEPNLSWLDTVNERKIPSFNDALKHQQEGDDLSVTIYFFKNYNDTTQAEIFDEVRRVISYYTERNLLSVNYEFDFYDENYFTNINTDQMHYCFQGRVFSYADCFESKYLAKIFHGIRLDHKLNDPMPTDAQLKTMVIPRGEIGRQLEKR